MENPVGTMPTLLARRPGSKRARRPPVEIHPSFYRDKHLPGLAAELTCRSAPVEVAVDQVRRPDLPDFGGSLFLVLEQGKVCLIGEAPVSLLAGRLPQ